jgi:hypothetical protein
MDLWAPLVAVFVVGIIVLPFMGYFQKSFVEIVIFACVIAAIGRVFFILNRAGFRWKRRQRAYLTLLS